MTLPRFVHRIYAWLNNYFWLPCPACGRKFGGHESHGGTMFDTANMGRTMCGRHPDNRWAGEGPCPHVAAIGFPAPANAATQCHICGQSLLEYRGIWAPDKFRFIPGVVS